MTSLKRSVQTWAAGGAAIGALFLAAGWIVGFAHSPDVLFAVMIADKPALWVVTFTPIVLSVIGGLLGLALAQFGQTQGDATELAERVAEGTTAAIHEHNVETVRTGSVQSEYFASLSHDMRTPLSAIIGFLRSARTAKTSHTATSSPTWPKSGQVRTACSASLPIFSMRRS
ncbi:MAG: hypothetical protein IIC71_05680 [Acidobacteria bacterium]|nr:hypothetical protein [Acidobacteriota bacterium]